MPRIYGNRRPGESLWEDMALEIRASRPAPVPIRTSVPPLWIAAPLSPVFIGLSFLSFLWNDPAGAIIFGLLGIIAVLVTLYWNRGYGLRANMEKQQSDEAASQWEAEMVARASNLQTLARQGWVERKKSPESEQATTYANGAAAEERTGLMLEQHSPENWEIAHDVEIVDEAGRVRANIDHLVCTPQGVFTIDAKAWVGHLVVRPDGSLASGLIHRDGTVNFIDRTQAANTVAWEATHIGLPVTPIIALDVGTAEEGVQEVMVRSGRVLVMPVESVIPYITARTGGMNLAFDMNRVAASSPSLHFG